MIVVLEGIDNSGKTYQANELKRILERQGTEVNINKEFFSKIRGVMTKMVNDGRIPSVVQKILEIKVVGHESKNCNWPPRELIIIDRFIHTVLAYAKVNDYYMNLCETLKRYRLYDLAIYVDITADEALERSRIANDNMDYSWDYLNSARMNYLKFVKSDGLKLLDGMRSKEEVTESLIALIKDHFNHH